MRRLRSPLFGTARRAAARRRFKRRRQVVADAVLRRIAASEERNMRGPGERNRVVRLWRPGPLAGEGVDVGGLDIRSAIDTDMVGAQSIDGDDEDVGAREGAAGGVGAPEHPVPSITVPSARHPAEARNRLIMRTRPLPPAPGIQYRPQHGQPQSAAFFLGNFEACPKGGWHLR